MLLRDQCPFARLGITFMVLVLLGGLAASAGHMYNQHENRDGQAGLTTTDLQGVYHGVRSPAPLLRALERGHPEAQDDANRQLLLDWLKGDRVSQDYDSLELGDFAPAEIIAADCLNCHGRNSGNAIADEFPLDYWTDINQIAVSRDVNPLDPKILMASTHTHAISLGVLALVTGLLMMMTRYHRCVSGALIAIAGIGLAADLGGWWLTRQNAAMLWLIIAGGTAFSGATAIMLLGIIADLWWPRRRSQASES